MLECYTDGACIGQEGQRRGGVGVYFPHDESWNISAPLAGDLQTNQRGEMAAIKAALERLDGKRVPLETQVTLYSDSAYSINCIAKWSTAWRRNGWKTSKKEDVLNQDLIRPCLALYEKRLPFIRLVWVKGHADCAGNIRADQLATAGSLQTPSSFSSSKFQALTSSSSLTSPIG